MNYCQMVDEMRAQWYSDSEINNEICCAISCAQEQFIEDYENDPFVQDGWHQQDIIDIYRMER